MSERLVPMACLAAMFCLPVFANETRADASFRGGPAHSGVYSSPSLRRLAGVAWTFPTGGPVRSSPTVSGGRVLIGSSDGGLYALDEKSGEQIWKFPTGGAVDSSPAVSGGTVFVASRDRSLYAVDERSGKEKWRFPMGPDAPFAWGYEWIIASPAVDGGRVFVAGGDGFVSCLSAESGAVRWRFRTGGRLRSSPAVAGGTVYQGSTDGVLYALDAATGKLRWKYETEGVRNDSEKAGFDRRSIASSPSVAGGVVTFGSRDAHQYALDAKTGRFLWRIAHPVAFTKEHAELAWCEGSPAISDGVSYVGSSDGYFVNAVEIATGKERWRDSMPSRIISSPAVTGDTLYVGCENGEVFGLDRETGRQLWRYRTGDSVYSSPSADGGLIFIGSDDGFLYALTASARGSGVPWKAVYWDEKTAGHYFQGGQAVRELLVGAGYTELDSERLRPFLESRAEDGFPSVVVFASDGVPSDALEAPDGSAPLVRRYLEAGGRIVWPGGPPLSIRCDPKSGKVTAFDMEAPAKVLGVGVDPKSSAEEVLSAATPEGAAWGLPGWSLGALAVLPSNDLTVLGVDGAGRPIAWAKKVGDRGEFVRFWGRKTPLRDLDLVKRIAERAIR